MNATFPLFSAVRATAARSTLAQSALVVLLNTLIAAVLTLLSSGDGFARNLVFSQCIGLSVYGWGLLLWRVPLPPRVAASRTMAATMVPAMPLGVLTGYSLAYPLLGEPVQIFSAGPGRVTAWIATVLGTALLTYLVAMRQRVVKEATERAQAERLATEAELRLLRAQIEPHMLFNTLANLRSLVDDDPRLAKTMLDELIVYLRNTLAASRTEWTTLRQEFEQLRAYLAIMAMRLGPRLRFDLHLPADLEETRIPPMLLQPLVENAIKHGIEPKVGGGAVRIEARAAAAGDIEIVVTDTGLGIDQRDGDGTGTRYGLAHVRDRLRSLWGQRADLTLAANPPQGTRASVRFPT